MVELFQIIRNNITFHFDIVFKKRELQENQVGNDTLLYYV